jgi:hypothetical protein
MLLVFSDLPINQGLMQNGTGQADRRRRCLIPVTMLPRIPHPLLSTKALLGLLLCPTQKQWTDST